MKAIRGVLGIGAFLAATFVFAEAKKGKTDPDLASVVPSFQVTPKDKVVKFVDCDSEAQCLRTLQEMDLQAGKETKDVTYLAEYVETPKRGIVVYEKRKP